jgi:type IV pilus assembly protein PilW
MNQFAVSKRTASARSQRGLTLIELMVAITVGLFIALGVGAFAATMSVQFRTTGSNSAADVNAQVALSLIDDAGRSAGAGLYNDGKPLCRTYNASRNGTTVANNAVFMPVRITDGGSAGASDTIVFTGGTAAGTLSSLPVLAPMANPGDAVTVSAGGTINSGDYALIGVPGGLQPCTLTQITAAPTPQTLASACADNASRCQTLTRGTGGSGNVNPSAPATAFATPVRYGFVSEPGVVGPAVVNRLGSDFRQSAFRVMCNALVTYNAFTDTPACTNSVSFSGGANALVNDVVLLHAQYGVSNTEDSDVVTSWVNASGSWAAPAAGDATRIKAIRIVLVTRAKEPDATQVSSACTNTGLVASTGPCGFDDAQAPAVDVSGLAVATGKTWRNYRYRVHQAVVPLRSVIWSL